MFNFSLFIFSITLLFLIFATFFDLRKRIIPNYLVFYLFFLGLIIKILESFFLSNINIFLNALLSFIITLIISYVLWEIGFFAGGDLKLFSAISILNPFNLIFFNISMSFGIISFPIFSITLILTSIISTAPLLIIHSLYLFIFKGHHFLLWKTLKNKDNFFSFLNSVIVLFFISTFLNIFSLSIPLSLYLLLSILFLLFFRKVEKLSVKSFYYLISIAYLLLIVYSFIFKNNLFSIYNLLTIIITIKIIFFGVTIYRIISQRILTTTKSVKNLTEGDVIAYNFYKKGKGVEERKVSFLKYLSLTIKNTYNKDLIIDSRRIGGLTLKEVTFLKSLYKNNLEKRIFLKKTIPFTPSVLVAYIILNIFGDFIWLFF